MPSSPSENSLPPAYTFTNQQVGPFSVLAVFSILYSWLIGHVPALESLHNSLLNALYSPLRGFDYPVSQIDALHGASLCMFKNLAHLPCLFCGLTRSFILIGRGQWVESMHYHPLGAPLYLLAIFFAGFGLIKPGWAQKALAILTTRNSLALALILFSACWLWKLGQSPRFW